MSIKVSSILVLCAVIVYCAMIHTVDADMGDNPDICQRCIVDFNAPECGGLCNSTFLFAECSRWCL